MKGKLSSVPIPECPYKQDECTLTAALMEAPVLVELWHKIMKRLTKF